MQIQNLATDAGGMTSNAFLVSGSTVGLVDTGAGFDVLSSIESRGLPLPEVVVLTHTHPDHVGNVDSFSSKGIPIYGFDESSGYVTDALDDGATIELGDDLFEAWYTPGHAQDHLCLFSETSKVLFSGDLIFPQGGVGRTDLPGCDHEDLIDSIERVLNHTDDSLEAMYAGHGPSVVTNPYQHVQQAARFVGIG